MNNTEINNILSKHSSEFGGVFPANSLSSIKNNSIVILNTDEIDKSGTHWVVMNINDQVCEFFDSLGNSPKFYHGYWHDFLLSHGEKYVFNDVRLQNENSSDCGKYCIFYVMLRSQGIQFNTIIRLLEHVDLNNFLNYLILT